MATASCPAHTLPIVSSSLASLFLPSDRATGKPSATAPMLRLPRSRSASPFCSGVPEARANSRASKASTQAESAVSAMAAVCVLLSEVQRIGSTRATWARTGGDASTCRRVCSRRRCHLVHDLKDTVGVGERGVFYFLRERAIPFARCSHDMLRCGMRKTGVVMRARKMRVQSSSSLWCVAYRTRWLSANEECFIFCGKGPSRLHVAGVLYAEPWAFSIVAAQANSQF